MDLVNDCLVIVGCLFPLLVRSLVATWPYSGAGKPPMFGDYEAQRHWMEVTTNLPVTQWYRNSSDNDLLYWGLDYPPASAYHMFLNGKVAAVLNKSFIALHSSRGLESYEHKVFMRATVLTADILFFFTAMVAYWKALRVKPRVTVVSLLYPALILIDHGHFQYNCVSLGLTVWAVVFLAKNNFCMASIAFTLAINYKQISMYHSLPIFFYLLAICWNQTSFWQRLFHLFKISFVVIVTFVICWLPFLRDVDDAVSVLRRLIPIDRGLFEDKVANVWCPLELVIKLRKHYDATTLFQLSSVATVMAVMPCSIHLFLRPCIRNLKYSLVQSSLAFFLFSFQVHEKGILLVGVAAGLLLDEHPLLVSWFFIVSTFSLQPLLLKDGLILPMLVLIVLYITVFHALFGDQGISECSTFWNKFCCLVFLASIYGYIALTASSFAAKPIRRWPDLFPLVFAVVSCGHFLLFYFIFAFLQFDSRFRSTGSRPSQYIADGSLRKSR